MSTNVQESITLINPSINPLNQTQTDPSKMIIND